MIRLKTASGDLQLPQNVKINLQLANPLFTEDNLSPGSFSLPFNLPVGDASPVNDTILKKPDVIENTQGTNKIAADLLFDDIPLKSGMLVIGAIKDNKATANLKFGLTSLDAGIKTKKLREVIDEPVTISTSNSPKKVYLTHPAAGPYKLNIGGQDFSEATISDLVTEINLTTVAVAAYFGAGSTPAGRPAPYMTLVPFTDANNPLSPLHVTWHTEDSRDTNGWFTEVDGLTNYFADFDTFLADHMDGTTTDERFRFPICFNDMEEPKKQQNWINMKALLGDIVKNIPASGVPFSYYSFNTLSPFLRTRWVLDKIAEYLQVELAGDFLTDIGNMLIWNPNGIDLWQDFLGDVQFLFWKRSFNCNELVPDVTVVDFLKALCSRYNVGCYLNEKTKQLVLCKREPIALAYTYRDVTAKAGRITDINPMQVDGIAYKTEVDTDDKYAVADDYTLGNGEKEVRVLAGGLSRTYTYAITNVTGPLVSQKQSEKYKLRFFHYAGMVDNGSGFDYPAADIHAATWDETLAGADGIFKNFFEYWARFEAARKSVPVKMTLTMRDLSALDWEEKQRIDRIDFLYKDIEVELTHTGMDVANVELYTMRT